MGLLKEFRDFALRGNVLDLAVGVIIGAAFGGIVNSMVSDLLMPVVGIVGEANFKDWYFPLSEKVRLAQDTYAAANGGKALPLDDARKAGSVLAYGNFITLVINFCILAFCIFLVVKAFNTAKKRMERQEAASPPPPAPPTKQEILLAEIRDLLARR